MYSSKLFNESSSSFVGKEAKFSFNAPGEPYVDPDRGKLMMTLSWLCISLFCFKGCPGDGKGNSWGLL